MKGACNLGNNGNQNDKTTMVNDDTFGEGEGEKGKARKQEAMTTVHDRMYSPGRWPGNHDRFG